MSKVLVGIVTYEGKDYIFPKCLEAVRNIDYNNFDILIVDNSSTMNYYHKMVQRGYGSDCTIKHLTRAKNSRDTLSDSQNYIRKYALENEYDYVLFIESDLVPPKEVINKLLSHNKLIVGSVYWLAGSDYLGNLNKIPCIFFTNVHSQGISGTRLIQMEELKDFLNTGLRTCHGCGLGCTLIHKSIIKRFPFWTDERFNNKHSDVYLYMDLHNAHIPVFIDTDLTVPHFPSKWEDVRDR